MKTKKLDTLERYTSVAVRAKISVEVEQRKRLGAWGKRVLVLDGTTLYAYKTKGDGGSVGGWAVGGADVHVRRSNDSNRDEGRHILVIARPPVYKLVFAFSTVYEQARMIQALSSSGATVTGLDAIMLLKNLRQQQEQEKKEEEQRKRAQNMQDTSQEEGPEKLTNGEPSLDDKENEIPEEPNSIDESIYDKGSGTVTNPLYASIEDVKKAKQGILGGASSQISGYINTSEVSDSGASHFSGVSANKDSEDKVNPVPKPPRASVSEGSPTRDSLEPDKAGNEKNVNKKDEEASCQQLEFSSDTEQQRLYTDVIPDIVVTEDSTQNDVSSQFNDGESFNDKKLVETLDSSQDSSDEESEGEGYYEINPDSQEGVGIQRKVTETEEGSDNNDEFESNYVELVSKMKLERALSIESNTGGTILETESPERIRKLLGDSPVSDESCKSPSPDNVLYHKETTNKLDSDKGYSERNYNQDKQNQSAVSEDTISDNDEKFEQLYQELSNYDAQNNPGVNNEVINNTEDKIQTQNKDEDRPLNVKEENQHLTEDETPSHQVDINEEEEKPESPTLKRVSSIIKKKGSPSTGKSKKVQFNLNATTIDNKSSDSPSSSLESLTKKKSEDGPTSPAKKRGIFSNIFSSASNKKSEVAIPKDEAPKKKDTSPEKVENSSKKDIPQVKVDNGNKKDSPTKVDTNKDPNSPKMEKSSSIKKTLPISQGSLKRQPTVDLTAPLIISGSVEMGGSITGKVNNRRIEVRDGHVLAFMPKASSPTSRLSLLGLSVTPLIGSMHANTLSLTRSNRCMMVIKLTSREEMMHWINILSDEVIKLTPENQRKGLVLYPSPKREEVKNKNEEKEDTTKESNTRDRETMDHNTTNGYTEGLSGEVHAEHKKETELKHNGDLEVASNGNKETAAIDEDTSDGWFNKKKQTTVEEFEMNEMKDREKGESTSTTVQIKPQHQQTLNTEQSKEDKEFVLTRKINKLNIKEIWKEQKETDNYTNIMNSPKRRQSLDSRQHPPLRRLSGQDHIRRIVNGNDAVGNPSLINNSPKRDYHANCHPPLTRLSNRSRVLSSSESNLRKFGDQNSRNTSKLHRFGSELTLREKTRKEVNDNLVNGTSDSSNVLVSSRIIRNQSYINKGSNQREKVNGLSPSSSPSHSRYKKSISYEPRDVEIIESVRMGSQELIQVGEDYWYDGKKPTQQQSEPPQEDLPGITWSVAATREKFELLCSVSGENKSGKLTTKTPISRKKSIKKRRSIEGGSGRRPNSRWGGRSPLQAANSHDSTNSATPLRSPTPTDSVSNRTSGKADDFIHPVRDLRKNFENDVPDNSDSYLTNSDSYITTSSSMDSVNDISNCITNNYTPATKEPSSPQKSPLRRTQNILHSANSPCSSPEPEYITSKLINSRPKFNIKEEDKGAVSRSLINQINPEKDSEVVICWRGPYIAQESDSGQNTDQSEENPKKDRKERKEAEQAVLSNISNAFLAKRRLLAREVASARIQEKLSALEETIWDIQASMAELDKQTSSGTAKASNNWKALERSLKTAEEDMAYWTSRLAQTQKEAEQAREKLAAALVTGLSQHNAGEQISSKHRQQLLKKFTSGSFKDDPQEEEEDEEEEEEEEDHTGGVEESFA